MQSNTFVNNHTDAARCVVATLERHCAFAASREPPSHKRRQIDNRQQLYVCESNTGNNKVTAQKQQQIIRTNKYNSTN